MLAHNGECVRAPSTKPSKCGIFGIVHMVLLLHFAQFRISDLGALVVFIHCVRIRCMDTEPTNQAIIPKCQSAKSIKF